MERPPNLLIKQRVLAEVGDRVVGADGDLAQVPRACVLVEHLDQKLFVLLRARLNHAPALELQAHAFHFAPLIHRGERVVHVPFDTEPATIFMTR